MRIQKFIGGRKLLAVAALAVAFSAASCQAPASVQTEAESTAANTVAETWTETEAQTQTEPMPAVREVSEVRIGMIFYGTEDESSVLSRSLREGLTAAALEAGLTEEQLQWVYIDREADWTEIEDSILSCVESGCQAIFGAAREYEGVIAAIAEEYPEVMFACVESSLSNGNNSGTYRIDLAAVQYLCGVAAGLTDETGHIGFLAAKGTENEFVTDAVNAFAYGVWSVNPEATVELGVTGKWYLPEAERQGILDFQGLDCDVAGGLTDSYVGLEAALEAGLSVTACGTDSWVAEEYRDQVAGVAAYDWSGYFGYMIQQVIDRQVTGEMWVGDLCSGAGSFATAGDWDLTESYERLISWFPGWEPVRPEVPDGSTETSEEGSPETSSETSSGTIPETSSETVSETASETVPETSMAEETVGTGEQETAEETEQAIESETAEETEQTAESETEPETEEEPESGTQDRLPEIEIDEETGYLANVRVHKIVVPEEE